ncbi:MAG: hypothetical protein JNK64_31175 [Myxococcales bacterium]|nr:hypothetical protein [Myxococcales bacterium]
MDGRLFMGLFFAIGAIAVFVVMPGLVIASRWRRWEPGMRRGMLTIYVALLVGCGLVALLLRRLTDGPL